MGNDMIFIEANDFETGRNVLINICKIKHVGTNKNKITTVSFCDDTQGILLESYEEVKTLIKKAIQERPIRDIRMEIPNDNITDIVNLIMKEIRNEISTKE
jgi:uncharacterized membrane protein